MSDKCRNCNGPIDHAIYAVRIKGFCGFTCENDALRTSIKEFIDTLDDQVGWLGSAADAKLDVLRELTK